MHESIVSNAVKHLQSVHYVTELRNVANSNRRMYIKVGVKQSERSTGGPWYTDGELDEAFVEVIADTLWQRILDDSVQMSKTGRHMIDKMARKKIAAREFREKRAAKEKGLKVPRKGVKSVSAAEALAIRDKALGKDAEENGRPCIRNRNWRMRNFCRILRAIRAMSKSIH